MRQIHKALQEVFDDPTRRGVSKALLYLFKNQPLANVTLATAAAVTFTVTGSPATLLVDGIPVSAAVGSTFTPSAAFVVPNTAGSNWCALAVSYDKFGNQYQSIGPLAGSLGAVQFPTIPDSKDGVVPLFYLILNNASAGTFTGGTTNTNTASLNWTFIYKLDGIYPMNNLGQV
jgi:hypothetical protein